MPQSLTIDQVFEQTKQFGRYQIFKAFMFALWLIPETCNYVFFAFAAIEPSWKCGSANLTTDSHDCNILAECAPENVTYDSQFYSATQEWNLLCQDSYIPKLMSSMLYIGRMLGELTFGWFVDNYGRKKSLIFSLAVLGCVGIGTSFAPNWKLLAVGTVLIGVTSGFLSDSIYAYVTELTTNRYRLVMRTVGGSALPRLTAQAFIAYMSKDWRLYLVYTNATSLILIVPTFLWVFESPRWLLQKERYSEAKAVMDKIAKFNGCKDKLPPDYQLETHKSRKTKFHLLDLFKQNTLLTVYTIFVCAVEFEQGLLWIISALELNKLTASIDLYLGLLMVGILGELSVFFAVVELRCSKVLNRRRLLLFLGISILLCNSALFMFRVSSFEPPILLSVVGVLSYALTMIKNDVNSCSKIELFPTLMRANVQALAGSTTAVGAIVAPQLLYAAEYWSPLPYLVLCLTTAATVTFTFLVYPNTNVMDLAEMERFTAEDTGDKIDANVTLLQIDSKL